MASSARTLVIAVTAAVAGALGVFAGSVGADQPRMEAALSHLEAAEREVPRHPRAFLFSIARNILIDRLRRDGVVAIDGSGCGWGAGGTGGRATSGGTGDFDGAGEDCAGSNGGRLEDVARDFEDVWVDGRADADSVEHDAE